MRESGFHRDSREKPRKIAGKWVVTGGLLILILLADRSFGQSPDSLDLKIAQMIMIGLPKAEIDRMLIQEVRLGKGGAIILFEKNIPPTNSFAALKKIIWTYQQASPIPLFIGIDQEGGKVNRLKVKYGFPRSISAKAMGAANRSEEHTSELQSPD